MTIEHNGHTIDVGVDRVMGGQIAFYDGQKMCRERGWGANFDATLEFRVTEDGEQINYEVDTRKTFFSRARIGEVRRNGRTIYTDRQS